MAITESFLPNCTLRTDLHNYLVHYGGRFWCIWSDGPKVEDWPTQQIKYATSDDGLTWKRHRETE